jgi:hypothetical protein
MSAALYIVLEKDVDFDYFVNGKVLSRVEPQLAELAEELGVPSLMSFFSVSPEEAEAFDIDLDEIEIPPAQWFDAVEGLRTVRALIDHLEGSPDSLANTDAILRDLREYEKVLGQADAQKVRWHLAVDG